MGDSAKSQDIYAKPTWSATPRQAPNEKIVDQSIRTRSSTDDICVFVVKFAMLATRMGLWSRAAWCGVWSTEGMGTQNRPMHERQSTRRQGSQRRRWCDAQDDEDLQKKAGKRVESTREWGRVFDEIGAASRRFGGHDRAHLAVFHGQDAIRAMKIPIIMTHGDDRLSFSL